MAESSRGEEEDEDILVVGLLIKKPPALFKRFSNPPRDRYLLFSSNNVKSVKFDNVKSLVNTKDDFVSTSCSSQVTEQACSVNHSVILSKEFQHTCPLSASSSLGLEERPAITSLGVLQEENCLSILPDPQENFPVAPPCPSPSLESCPSRLLCESQDCKEYSASPVICQSQDYPTVPSPPLSPKKNCVVPPPQHKLTPRRQDFKADCSLLEEQAVKIYIQKVYHCNICLRMDFGSREAFIQHYTDVHEILDTFKCRFMPCPRTNKLAPNQKDVNRYEGFLGHPIPGRVYTEDYESSESEESSEWEDYSESEGTEVSLELEESDSEYIVDADSSVSEDDFDDDSPVRNFKKKLKLTVNQG